MKTVAMLGLFCGLCGFLSQSPAQEKSASEMKKMEGTWKVKSMQIGGAEATEADRQKITVTVEKESLIFNDSRTKPVTYQLTLNSSKTPGEFDLNPQSKNVPASKGIYKWEGNTLTICLSDTGTRPTEFVSKPKSTTVVLVLEKK